jgi:hypothetical protein
VKPLWAGWNLGASNGNAKLERWHQ